MTDKSIAPGARPAHRAGIFQEHEHDTYKSRAKLPSPTLCPDCGAVYQDGRWQWLPRPEAAHAERCPACHRVSDRYPAGYVRIEGDFAARHREDIVALVRNLEAKEKAEHPLQRVIAMEDSEGGLLVTTTDVHLAHGIGEALRHAYKGELESKYSDEEKRVRVRWSR